ncbi:MAG: hypothetical protein ACJA1F_001635 [Paracoccaceae bacterium]|jgi:hypothetical protein
MFGAMGVLIGQAFGGLVFGVLAMWLANRVVNQQATATPVAPFAREGRLLTLLHLRR